ncbi:MAG: hypothetical protein Q9191_007163 [Dirinaria sp. TL-2023a]
MIHIENSYASGLRKRPRGPRSTPTVDTTSKLDLILQPPLADLKTQAITYYVRHHLQTLEDIPSISKDVSSAVLPIWSSKVETPVLDLAVSSLALAVFSRIKQHSKAAIEASQNYEQLLQLLRTKILSLNSDTIDTCLLAIFHMSRYEEAIHQSGHSYPKTPLRTALRSFSHHDGALAILRIWREQLNHSGPATDIIKHTRRGLIRSALLRNLAVPEWMQDGAKFGEQGHDLEYDGIVVRIATLRQRLSTLVKDNLFADHHYHDVASVAKELNKEAVAIDIALQNWRSHFSTAWYYERHDLPDSSAWPTKDFWSPVVYSYASIPYAAVWTQYYAMRMLINSTHLTIFEFFVPFSDNLTWNQHLDCLSNMKLMGDDLASSLPFCLQKFKVTKSSESSYHGKSIKPSTNGDIKPQLATLIVWPLTIASSLRNVDVQQRLWFRSVLAHLGKLVGLSVLECAEDDLWLEL